MDINLTYLFEALILFSLLSFFLAAFIVGKLPARVGAGNNRVLWGDKSVNPKLLTGFRARTCSLLLIIIFSLIALVALNKNASLYNSVAMLIGATIGVATYRILLKKAEVGGI
ncbi:MAG: hypothetical protein V4664_01435 [Patescibacteria group bacterium]